MSESIDPGVFREYVFAIADAESAEYLPEGLVTERLTPKILMSSAHLMPMLIDLKRSPAGTRDALFDLVRHRGENTEPPPVAQFIKTNVSAAEISRHWNVMQLAQPQPGRKQWLRLHDPRVLHQLLRILNPMQRKKLFGLSFTFTYWIGGEWVIAQRGCADRPQAQIGIDDGVQPYAGPARWDWPRIERIGLVNRALHRAGIRHAEMLLSLGALAEQLMDRAAKRHRLAAQNDLVEFATRGLMIHPAFDEHVEVAPLIKPANTLADQSNLSDRLSLVEDHVWNELLRSEKILNGNRL
jgi:hypothetical protein